MKIVINIKRKAWLKEVKNVKEIRKGFENAIDFLMFSYFGISLEDGEDREQILDVAVKRAYIDATQQGSYNAMLKGKNKDASKEIKDKAIQRLKEAVDEYGLLGIFLGGLKASAAGISAALIFAYLASIIFQPKMKK